MRDIAVFWITVICWFVVLTSSPVKSIGPEIRFISVHMGNNPNSGYMAVQPAVDYALDQMNETFPGLLNNYTYLSKNSTELQVCGASDIDVSVKEVASLFKERQLQGGRSIVIAARCFESFKVVGDFGRELDFLVLPCQSDELGYHDRQRFPTTVSFAPTGTAFVASALLQVMDKFEWKSIAIINDKLSKSPIAGKNQNICRGVIAALRSRAGSISSINYIVIETDSFRNSANQSLLEASKFSRIILSCTIARPQRRLLAAATELQMTKGDYVFLHIYQLEATPSDEPLTWNKNETIDEAVLEALKSTLIVRTPEVPWNKMEKTIKDIQENRQEMFNLSTSTANDPKNEVTIACMESVWAAWQVLNETCFGLEGDSCDTSGRALSERFFNRTFALPLRDVTINDFGMRVIRTEVHQFNLAKGIYEIIFWATSESQSLKPGKGEAQWLLGKPPLDRPLCGLEGQYCQKSILWTYLLALGLIILFAIVTVIFLREMAIDSVAHDNWWMLNTNELVSQTHGHSTTLSHSRRTSRRTIHSTSFNYRGDIVWTQSVLLSKPFTPTRKVRIILGKLKRLDHNNLNPLKGLLLSPGTVTFVTPFWPKGSLEDICEKRDAEWDLQSSLCAGLLEGLSYIHDSFLGLHGLLKSSKCLIDNRFELKITAAGQEKILHDFIKSDDYSSDWENDIAATPEDFFWTAPELLNGSVLFSSQTPKTDVYAVGIILHQIIVWGGAFAEHTDIGLCYEKAAIIISRVQHVEVPPFRPKLPVGGCSAELKNLVMQCWSENPNQRPNISSVLRRFQKLENNSGGLNLMDKVMRRLQTYADELEELVAIRTGELMDERQKCDELLKEMLPALIVQRLRSGLDVQGEIFEAVTVYFSDVVGFQSFAANSQPMEVISFLSHTYATCDQVLHGRDVYKVETISDSYMIASGLPLRNGNAHATEIALTALKMREVFTEFCGTDSLQLRIGIHSGSCAACVVGIKTPRYCLFGDTVNTASRMESHGEALKIHVSLSTAEYLLKLPMFLLEERGLVAIKGKGDVKTYWLLSVQSQEY